MSDSRAEEGPSSTPAWQYVLVAALILWLVVVSLIVVVGHQVQESANEPDHARVQFFPDNDTVIVTQTSPANPDLSVGFSHRDYGSSSAKLNSVGDKIILNESGLTATGSAEIIQNDTVGIEDGDTIRVHGATDVEDQWTVEGDV